MFRAGEWLSIAVLGLVVLFIINSIAFFTFLIGPEGTGPTTTVEPSTAYLQFIFMSLAPAIGLSFFTNVLSEGITVILLTSISIWNLLDIRDDLYNYIDPYDNGN